ncbi:MAG TPA: hypothetical protein DEG43_04170 [Acidimicrobiaceae bacterium]|nr:hypothetical protein [Acidimicrobiaceae bacterium]
MTKGHDVAQERSFVPGEALTDRFEQFVRAAPEVISVRDDSGSSLSRIQLWDQAAALSQTLAGSGVRARDVVLVLLPNRVEWQVALLACLQLGAVPATIPMTTDARTLAYVLELIGARAIITLPHHRRAATGERVLEAARQAGNACQVLTLQDDGAYLTTEINGRRPPSAPEHLEHLMFTSSTTGWPKAVMHTRDTLAAVNRGFAERFGISESTPLFMPSPVGHSVGAWHGGRLSLFCGAQLVLQDEWDPQKALQTVEEHQCYFTAAATPFLKDLVDAPWDNPHPKLASLRAFLCGGAPVPPHLLEEAGVQMPNTFVTVLWGMTEGGVTTGVPGEDASRSVGLAGLPLPGLELRILSDESAPGEGEGELAMRGPGVFVGYMGQEDLYQASVTPDGFFRTGDLARLEPNGYLKLTGRLKDLIVRGGVNLSPIPIEEAIARHPSVRQVAVIGSPDERIGERICAVVVLDRGFEIDLPQLNEWLTGQGLSRRLLPERLMVVSDMPVTAAGKIRKVDLKPMVEQAKPSGKTSTAINSQEEDES